MKAKRFTITIEVDEDAYGQEYGWDPDAEPEMPVDYARAVAVEGATGRLQAVGGWAWVVAR